MLSGLLSKSFAPEFLNRLDDMIIFNSLTEEDLYNIIDIQLDDLRTNLLRKNNKLIVQSGGGIVYDSNSEKEYQETINKAKALIKAAEESYKYENN